MPVDVGLATTSNQLITGGLVAYSLAFVGYAVRAAFGVRIPDADAAPTPARVLVGVTSPADSATAGAPTSVALPAGAPRSGSAEGTVLDGDAAGAGRDRETVGPRDPATRFGEVVGKVAVVLTVIGWVAHGAAIATRGLAVHRLPWGNMYEFTLALTFAAVAAFLGVLARHRRQSLGLLGVFVMIPVLLALGLAILVLYVAPAPLVPALHSYWLGIHVTAAIIATGVFTVATASTVMFLVADHYAAAVSRGRPVRFAAIARMMPDSGVLDRVAYRAYALAFPIWTFAVVAGAIWAQYAWGHYWQWDPKETWSFITWVIYAGYLHARATAGWRGRKAAYIALLGFATVLFNFFVVNIFITGMHSYAGV